MDDNDTNFANAQKMRRLFFDYSFSYSSIILSFVLYVLCSMQVTNHHLTTIIERAQHWQVRKVVLFGGALEHPDNTNDIDIAVDAPDVIAFAVDLDAHLSCSVDVVPIQPNTPFIDHILQKGHILYAA